MGLTITTLSENTVASGALMGELGLSTLLDTGTSCIMFDAGQTTSVSHNAATIGIDLDRVDKIVLSHGHFDHTGGLRSVLQRMGRQVEVVAHPDVWSAKYGRREGAPDRYIGIPFQQAELESLGARFTMSRRPVILAPDILTTGEVPMITDFEQIDPHLFVKEGGTFRPDRFEDDLSVVVKTGAGLVVALGCAHRGMINHLYHAQKITGVKEISMVLGGSHLLGASDERLSMTVAALKDLNVGRIGLCHCTGLAAAVVLAREFEDRFFFNNTGNRVEVGG